MMDNQKLEATYLVDDNYLLHLREENEGIRYHCFDRRDGSDAGSGLVSWGDMEESTIRSPLACARVLAIQEIGLDGEKVAAVSPDMLSQFPRGRRMLRELGNLEADTPHSIRFIDSRYNEKFRIPDGGVIQVTYPERRFSQRCSYIDDYHMEAGYSVYHICQFAEMLERGGGSCRPEPLVLEEEAAWKVNGKGYLSIQTCDDGYDYTLYDTDFHEIDGGQLDTPGASMNEIRDEILSDMGWERRTMVRLDYDILQDRVSEVEAMELPERRQSVLEQIAGLKSVSSEKEGDVPKRKEPER